MGREDDHENAEGQVQCPVRLLTAVYGRRMREHDKMEKEKRKKQPRPPQWW